MPHQSKQGCRNDLLQAPDMNKTSRACLPFWLDATSDIHSSGDLSEEIISDTSSTSGDEDCSTFDVESENEGSISTMAQHISTPLSYL